MGQFYNIDAHQETHNKVKELVLERLVKEKLISEDDAEEFMDRCHVIEYKQKWFQRWTTDSKGKLKDGWFLRMIDVIDKKSEDVWESDIITEEDEK